jgi:hypothetical protein
MYFPIKEKKRERERGEETTPPSKNTVISMREGEREVGEVSFFASNCCCCE